jgi:hypothetical protein
VQAYYAGQTFSYKYHSLVTTTAERSGDKDQTQFQDISCIASFVCLATNSRGSYFKLVLSSLRTRIGVESEYDESTSDDSAEYYALPLYFVKLLDGTVTDVVSDPLDDEEGITLKTAVAQALQAQVPLDRTHSCVLIDEPVLSIDSTGYHYQYASLEQFEDRELMTTFHTEDDYIGFMDERMDEEDVKVESETSTVLCGTAVLSSYSRLSVVFNRQESLSNSDDDVVQFVSSGISELTDYATGNDESVDFGYPNFEDFVNERSLRPVPHLSPQWYKNRQSRAQKLLEKQASDFVELDRGVPTCPGDIDFCKGFDNTWTVGNSNAGIRMHLSVMAGIKKGCSTASRSYMAGAYASMDALIIGKTKNMVDAHCEYGQVNGSPMKNEIKLSLFGNTIYSKTFPYLDCIDRTIQLQKWNKEFKYSFTIVVYVVPISFYVALEISYDSKIQYTICPNGLKASMSFIPTVSLALSGGASASVAVAKAGIEVRGTISDFLDPTVYADGNLCRVGLSLYNNVSPITVGLYGYYQLRKVSIKGFKISITWGKKHNLTIWSHQWPASRQKIFDQYFGAR